MSPRRSVRSFGDTALLAATDGPREARALATAVMAAGWAEEVVVGLRSVLVVCDPDDSVAGRALVLTDLRPADQPPGARREVRIPVTFDGPDVEEVCGLTDLRPDDLVQLLTGASLEVAVTGFSPGFPYLTGLPTELAQVPRRDQPRTVVPAGSVAVAAGFAGIYPQSTPGGWRLVGRTGLALFDPHVPPFALLRPGDRVRFDAAPATQAPAVSPASGANRRPLRLPPGTRGALVVERPGLLTLVQDGGRRGLAQAGIPPAGPADPLAHGLANRLVGNPPQAAALELTAAGPILRCTGAGYLAVVGANPAVAVDGHPVTSGHLVPLAVGQRVAIGAIRDGLRSYLAWAGGLVVPEVVGSRSTDLLSGLGPGPLAAGDELGAGPAPGLLHDHLATGDTGDRLTLRVLPGPHPEWFPADVLEQLAGEPLLVGGSSDRVGLRLAPDRPVPRAAGELASAGMVTGAVQVPPDGHPVVLGPDHATLGGYPVAAVVIAADRWKLGQCCPGDRVRLVPVSDQQAVQARAALRRLLGTAAVGHYPVVAG